MINLKNTEKLWVLAVALLLCACATLKTSPSIVVEENQIMEQEVKSSVDIEAAQIVVGGKFQSVAGMMDELNCYCSNGGYVISSSGKKLAVCFLEDQHPNNCSEIEVTGTYKTKHLETDPSSPCSVGSMTYLEVKTFICK